MQYRKAQERLMQAAYQYGQAQVAMEEAEQEFKAALKALEDLEGQTLPTAEDVRGILINQQNRNDT